jgi:hypothetical protein
MAFVEHFMDPSDLCEAGMMLGPYFFFVMCSYSRNSATVQLIMFVVLGVV